MPKVSVQVTVGTNDGWASVGTPAYDNNDSKMHCGFNPTGWDLNSWMLFTNVAVPKGATIKSAFLRLYAGGDRGSTVNTQIYGNKIANAVAPTDLTEYSALALTTAFTTWDGVSAQYPIGAGQPILSPDISSVVQEIVDQTGWNKNNALQIIWKNNGSDQYYSIWQYDGSAAKAATLIVEYSIAYIWIESNDFHLIDAEAVERVLAPTNNIATYEGVVQTHEGNVLYH